MPIHACSKEKHSKIKHDLPTKCNNDPVCTKRKYFIFSYCLEKLMKDNDNRHKEAIKIVRSYKTRNTM